MTNYNDCASCMVYFAKLGWMYREAVIDTAISRGITVEEMKQLIHESEGHDKYRY